MRFTGSFPLALLALAACHSGQTSSGAPASNAPAAAATGNMTAMPSTGPAVAAMTMEQAGEYLTIVGSCNDCHTQGWTESKGKIPPADRFAGFDVGFRGAWGTVYGKNLRTITQRQTEDHWVKVLQTADDGDGKPPMPWWNTAQMSERDLRAMYRYIKSLGPNTKGVPRNLPVGKEPTGPWVWVTPKTGP
ncbi:MAG: cytochrome C [Gemmatimonadota bacterium]